MPGGDRTGPVGSGSMSGRAAGFCAGYGMPGYANQGFGLGRGMGRMRGRGPGRGRGMGLGGWWGVPGGRYFGGFPTGAAAYGPLSEPRVYSRDESEWLKEQADALQRELKSVEARLAELESTAGE